MILPNKIKYYIGLLALCVLSINTLGVDNDMVQTNSLKDITNVKNELDKLNKIKRNCQSDPSDKLADRIKEILDQKLIDEFKEVSPLITYNNLIHYMLNENNDKSSEQKKFIKEYIKKYVFKLFLDFQKNQEKLGLQAPLKEIFAPDRVDNNLVQEYISQLMMCWSENMDPGQDGIEDNELDERLMGKLPGQICQKNLNKNSKFERLYIKNDHENSNKILFYLYPFMHLSFYSHRNYGLNFDIKNVQNKVNKEFAENMKQYLSYNKSSDMDFTKEEEYIEKLQGRPFKLKKVSNNYTRLARLALHARKFERTKQKPDTEKIINVKSSLDIDLEFNKGKMLLSKKINYEIDDIYEEGIYLDSQRRRIRKFIEDLEDELAVLEEDIEDLKDDDGADPEEIEKQMEEVENVREYILEEQTKLEENLKEIQGIEGKREGIQKRKIILNEELETKYMEKKNEILKNIFYMIK